MLQRWRARLAADDGFSLMEAMVAMSIAVIALLSLLATSVYAVRTSVESRKNQQAGDLLNAAIEKARALKFSEITMTTADVNATTDPNVNKLVSPPTFTTDAGVENLDVRSVGLISPYRVVQSTPNGDYTVSRYVTIPSAATFNQQEIPSIRRLTVVVEWSLYGKPHRRSASTILTNTRRGLPQPYFTFAYNGPAPLVSTIPTWTKNAGNTVDYGFYVRNLGATDSWAIRAETGVTTGWSYYLDTDRDGLWSGDAVAEPPMSSSTVVTSAASTGTIAAGADSIYLVARRTIASSELGTTTTTVFYARSEAQPTFTPKTVTTALIVSGTVVAPTASPTSTASPSASSEPCNPGASTGVGGDSSGPTAVVPNSYDLESLALYNGPTAGDTATQTFNSAGTDTSGLQTRICNLSNDLQVNEAGRLLTNGASIPSSRAEWRFQPSSQSQDQAAGTAAMRIWVQCVGTVTLANLRFEVGTLTGSTGVYEAKGSATTPVSSCPSTSFRVLDLSTSFSNINLSPGSNDRLVFRVTTNQDVRLLYGTTTTAARVAIALK